jgi:hypothetical protein
MAHTFETVQISISGATGHGYSDAQSAIAGVLSLANQHDETIDR